MSTVARPYQYLLPQSGGVLRTADLVIHVADADVSAMKMTMGLHKLPRMLYVQTYNVMGPSFDTL